jgi:hypothetical protein
MDPYSLLLALTMACGLLGALGLLVTLTALEWSTSRAPATIKPEPVNRYSLAKCSKAPTSRGRLR